MDAKEILRIIIQQRFWIILGFAALFPIIAFFVSAGAVSQATESKTGEITSAKDGANKYASAPNPPNGQYEAFTTEKISTIESDVNTAWNLLYERQAPLLDWPEQVAATLKEWGREIPANVAPNAERKVGVRYVQVYKKYAEEIYELFDPWDSVTGEGIVVAPPMESLLATVDLESQEVEPSINKIWQLQENLWVRRAILQVVAAVNDDAGATDWESAPVKQINMLEVGNAASVDHRTSAEGYELQDPEEVLREGETASTASTAAASGTSSAAAPRGGGSSMYMEEMMGGMTGADGMMAGVGGRASKAGEPVRFLSPDGVKQFRDYPALISVLIDQNSIQEFLVAFENAAMPMRVLEMNWVRPSTPVEPPVKGQQARFGGGYGIGSGGGILGMEDMMMSMMGGAGGRGGPGTSYGAGYGDESYMDEMMGSMMGMGMGRGQMGSGRTARRQSVRRDLTKSEETEEESDKDEQMVIFDPYYNIVELQVYVRARFFYEPTELPGLKEQSPGATEPDALADPSSTTETDSSAETTESDPSTLIDSEVTDLEPTEAVEEPTTPESEPVETDSASEESDVSDSTPAAPQG